MFNKKLKQHISALEYRMASLERKCDELHKIVTADFRCEHCNFIGKNMKGLHIHKGRVHGKVAAQSN